MKRVGILKKIGGIVLSAAVTVSVGALVFVMADNNKITAFAEEAEAKETVEKKAEQKINAKLDVAIDKAAQEAAAAGKETGSIRIDGREMGINTLSRDLIVLLSDSKVDAEFLFNYEGYCYTLYIPAGATPIDEDIPWYGPMYLLSLYWQTATVTPIA